MKTNATVQWYTMKASTDLVKYIDGLVQGWSNSSALAMKLLKSCVKPSMYAFYGVQFIFL